MAGQEKVNNYNQSELYNKYFDILKKQSDLLYLKENFAIDSKYDENVFLHSYLYQKALSDNDCELVKWVDKKMRGKLDNSKIKKINNLSTQYTDNDIHIHNHYYNADVWDISEW